VELQRLANECHSFHGDWKYPIKLRYVKRYDTLINLQILILSEYSLLLMLATLYCSAARAIFSEWVLALFDGWYFYKQLFNTS
jgi:hypothetical protein